MPVLRFLDNFLIQNLFAYHKGNGFFRYNPSYDLQT